jgi:hypothetical protein
MEVGGLTDACMPLEMFKFAKPRCAIRTMVRPTGHFHSTVAVKRCCVSVATPVMVEYRTMENLPDLLQRNRGSNNYQWSHLEME